jgi:hypothetical protein
LARGTGISPTLGFWRLNRSAPVSAPSDARRVATRITGPGNRSTAARRDGGRMQRAVAAAGGAELAEPEPVPGRDEPDLVSVARGGCPTACMPMAESGGSAPICGRPVSLITGDHALLGPGRWPDQRRGAGRAARRVDRGGPLLLVILAIKTAAAARPRVTRNMLGCNVSPASTNCRLLLRGRERLSPAGLTRKWNGCVDDDPTAQILFARSRKRHPGRCVRRATRSGHCENPRRRTWAFYRWWAHAAISELTTVAETIETWRPPITTRLTKAPTEGTNRLIKPVKRAAAASGTGPTTDAGCGRTAPGKPADYQRGNRRRPPKVEEPR